MRDRQNQRGDALAVILIVIVVVLLGVLGYVYWHNATAQKTPPAATKSATQATTQTTPATKTYHDRATGVSFEYPADWTVKNTHSKSVAWSSLPASGIGPLSLVISDSKGVAVAYLDTQLEFGKSEPVPDSEETPWDALAVVANDQTVSSCALGAWAQAGAYDVMSGYTTDSDCRKVGTTIKVGNSPFEIDSSDSTIGTFSFSNSDFTTDNADSGEASYNMVYYKTKAAAQAFVASSEYQQMAAMYASLKLS